MRRGLQGIASLFRRYFDLRGFLLGCAVVFSIILIQGVPQIRLQWNEWRAEQALGAVIKCLQTEHATQCSVPHIGRLLELRSGKEVMSMLEQRLTPSQCHYIGHVVGQKSYLKFRDFESAVAQCSRACDTACLHGVIGEMFAEELGYDPKLEAEMDFQHLNAEDVYAIGKRLCTTSQTCHGVGHTLFQIFGSFNEGLRACERSSEGHYLEYCANGLFMEYADYLSQKEIGTSREYGYPEIDSLGEFCDWESKYEMRACFRYLPRIGITTYEAHGFSRVEARERMRSLCAAYPDGQKRIACFAGLGWYSAYLILNDTQKAIAECEIMPREQDRAACFIGQASVATNDRREKIVSYCGQLPRDNLRSLCYHGFFNIFASAGGALSVMETLCQSDNKTCRAAINSRSEDIWLSVESFF